MHIKTTHTNLVNYQQNLWWCEENLKPGVSSLHYYEYIWNLKFPSRQPKLNQVTSFLAWLNIFQSFWVDTTL